MSTMKYADLLVEWLRRDGYTHCFFVAGGNNMHLLDGVRSQMDCVAFVHEVAAGIAAEYFNEVAVDERAFVLVTAGPGLTNITTAMAGAFLESRDLLVVGGQVKSTDLADGGVRQRGIQEVDGISMVRPVCVDTMLMTEPAGRKEVLAAIHRGRTPRKGPVFIEICLDAQAAPVERTGLELDEPRGFDWSPPEASADNWNEVARMLAVAERPAILLGGGVSRECASASLSRLRDFGVPLLTTWNAMDRLGHDEPLYFGRPDTWGQRRANIVMQSTDLLIVIGARLSLQQTGFNWQQFTPVGRVVQVEIDQSELDKGHPVVDLPIRADADLFLESLLDLPHGDLCDWLSFCAEVRDLLPLSEPANSTHPGFHNPYEFSLALSERCETDDIFMPCSSGGAETVQMQAFQQKAGQTIVNDKSLASMGYGLAGAIGAAIAGNGRRTILTEGDGGFSQNLQELAIAGVRNLPLKVFLHANEGYASIRMTQKNYFEGDYLGCDISTGLGFPDWLKLFDAYGIPAIELDEHGLEDPRFDALFNASGPAAFIVNIHPEQTYLPKISSRVLTNGGMESNPLHLMSPDLDSEVAARVLRFIDSTDRQRDRQSS
jgi:acetolactate synthase-1/2/3 large subunit